MNAVYLHDWSDFDGMVESFRDYGADVAEHARLFEGVEVLLASYSYEDYSGLAFVLFRKGGELFEVNGSHCSCYGLEDQWEPEPTTVAALTHRLDQGQLGNGHYDGGGTFADELRAVLDAMDGAA